MAEVPVPRGRWREGAAVEEEPIRARAVERFDLAAAFDGRAARHPPGAMAMAVEVAIRAQRIQLESERQRAAQQREAHGRRVLAVHHDDPLLEQRVAERVFPHRQRAFEPERVEMLEAARIDGAVSVLVGRKPVAHTAVLRKDFDLRDQHRALRRRLQRRDEQPVVAPRTSAGDRARREPAEAIRQQPLALCRALELVELAAAELNDWQRHRRRRGRSRARSREGTARRAGRRAKPPL
jgi:hypothetical protein